ncbi:protein O-mannosyl-transferase family, partial [Gemmatimonadota bacterium]
MIDYRPPYRAALLSGLGVFLLYVLTLSPSTAMWDTSEYIATAHILGIPHPPGNPLFVALAKVWSILLAPLGFSVAVRINLLAAATSAAAAGFYFMVVHRILWGFLKNVTPPVTGTRRGIDEGAGLFKSTNGGETWE